MILLIGTGHVFNLSDALIQIFNAREPDVLCVELDAQRYQGLRYKKQHPEEAARRQGNEPFTYRMLARFQDSLAKQYGVTAGEEMLTTGQYAQEHQLPLMCIDRNAQQVFQRMLKSMTVREKLRLFFSGIGGLFISRKKVEKQINSIGDNIETYLEQIQDKFPTIKRVLIDERNTYMVKQLVSLQKTYETVIAVVGDGHIPGLVTLLDEQQITVETIRLKELQNMKQSEDSSQATFTIHQHSL